MSILTSELDSRVVAAGARAVEPAHGQHAAAESSGRRNEPPSAEKVHFAAACREKVVVRVHVDQGHPWTAPFSLARVGAPVLARVELTSDQPLQREYYVVARRAGINSERLALIMHMDSASSAAAKPKKDPLLYFGAVSFAEIPEEVSFYALCRYSGQVQELARKRVSWPAIEADVIARDDRRGNPVDLGAIFVPHDWLLITRGQSASLSVAAVAHARSIPSARVRAWFEGRRATEVDVRLERGKRVLKRIDVPSPTSGEQAVLHVSLTDGRQELWRKEVQTMLVGRPSSWPAFGAIETKLRYDLPIAVYDPSSGDRLQSLDYKTAWDPRLHDVVVFLPNGSRFVFWRGSSYIPFWAGPHNTAACYQWAENFSVPVSHPDGSVDLPEPLFDQELRYGRVSIVDSTASRVHVRWSYRMTDVHYNTWGDQATEDYYFYPDSFGTRVVTVIAEPETPYQLTEFIVLTPPRAFPLDVLPHHMMDVLFLDGEKESVDFPLLGRPGTGNGPIDLLAYPRKVPAIYRLFVHKDDPSAAIYFGGRDLALPAAYRPFTDQGETVTPAYWGSHWPLSRGRWTHWMIDDGIYSGPAHNSVAGWFGMSKPISTSTYLMPDALGRPRNMQIRRWVALIAKTDISDESLRDWARSFLEVPSLEVIGGRIAFPSYSPEGRAIRVAVESSSVRIKLKPAKRSVNPVFELAQAPPLLRNVTVGGKKLPNAAYRWDGSILWLNITVEEAGTEIVLNFS